MLRDLFIFPKNNPKQHKGNANTNKATRQTKDIEIANVNTSYDIGHMRRNNNGNAIEITPIIDSARAMVPK